MSLVHPVHAKIYATGFERGSHVTLQTVMAWLDAYGLSVWSERLSIASSDGHLEQFRPQPSPAANPPEPAPIADPVGPTDLGPPKMNREQATQSGFTGNTCSCGSMMMVRNGTCEKCLTCGSTTGCS
jgi:hypothetical protein